jgi:hypothetical protein
MLGGIPERAHSLHGLHIPSAQVISDSLGRQSGAPTGEVEDRSPGRRKPHDHAPAQRRRHPFTPGVTLTAFQTHPNECQHERKS